MLPYILHHGLDRQRRKVSVLSVRLKQLVHRLLSLVVWNSRICKVNSHLLDGDAGSSACLAYVQEDVYKRQSWFFFQVLFVGGSGGLLVQGTLKGLGYEVELIDLAKVEIPVALTAHVVACIYFTLKDKRLRQKYLKSGRSEKGKS